ncbi:tail fiber protein [Rhizobium sp. Root1240]|uniref:tail fiber protein n=1 Tax=Rhizobium sp. Root1240 TaxID=1736437 RepID=UPI00138F7EF0|nr:tail fiber protein [Rhizobium sp. Root1240]
MLDAILKSLLDAVNAKAAATHTHAISQVVGLAAELAAKMPASQTFKLDDLTDVSGADAASNNYILVKSALGWIPSSALAALGTHGHLISEISGLVSALAAKADASSLAAGLGGKSDVGHSHAISDVTGLSDALLAAVPAGLVAAFAMSSAPTGWLKANGAAVSRTTYAALFAAIGTTFGAGNGSTTFNVPDLRGEFVRGLDDGRGVDASRALGSAQSSQNLSHSHTGTADSAGAHTHPIDAYDSNSASPGSGRAEVSSQTATSTINTGSAGAHAHNLTIAANGGTEARPRNVALLLCIKF